MNITIDLVSSEAGRQTVRHFFLAFFYDLSRYDPGIVIVESGLPHYVPSGNPAPRTFDEFIESNFWVRGDCVQHIIRVDGLPAGYATVCSDCDHIPPEIDFELLDFYIAPPYRGQGIGRQAARLVFDAHRGAWQVFELATNEPAKAFWRRVIDEYTGGSFENLDGGTQQRFRN
ncbi:MAG: GNAT family N-acetyltransferase [Anaerolineae bacterium]|nr:GNAT family N-acetyltransferase [Anaerolineae bacterium]